MNKILIRDNNLEGCMITQGLRSGNFNEINLNLYYFFYLNI